MKRLTDEELQRAIYGTEKYVTGETLSSFILAAQRGKKGRRKVSDGLKPCPFCAQNDALRIVPLPLLGNAIVCDRCGTKTSWGDGVTQEKAAELWNTRTEATDAKD